MRPRERREDEMSRRAQAMIAGYESGRIRMRFDQLMSRVNCGMLPAHVEAEIAAILAEMPPLEEHLT